MRAVQLFCLMLQEDSRRKSEQYTPLNRLIFILKEITLTYSITSSLLVNLLRVIHIIHYNNHKRLQYRFNTPDVHFCI